jgi:hypothetical protein
MKKLLLFSLLLQSIVSLSQVPQGINYQATARNTAGVAITNQSVNFRFSLIQSVITNSPTYSETFVATTDDLGHVNLIIGKGTVILGTFSQINWAAGPYFLKVELDSGSGYTNMGTTELMSVPYALYASNTSLKTISGISSGGASSTILAGTGFTVTNPSTGTYTVSFNTPFLAPPTVVASVYVTNTSQISINEFVSVRNITINGCTIHTKNGNGLVQNIPFSFIAVGQ